MAQFFKRPWISQFIQDSLNQNNQELLQELEHKDIQDRYLFLNEHFKPKRNPGRAQIVRV